MRSTAMIDPSMQKPITEVIRQRFSCRTYLDKPIDDQRRRRLAEFLAAHQVGPLGSRARFALVAATEGDHEALRGLGTYGFIKGATGFIVGAAERSPKDLEDYGYLMEHAILFATDLGLGTCWLGGTFSKSRFSKKIDVHCDEIVPAVTAVGTIAEGAHARDWIREQAKGTDRLPAGQLFFDQQFGRPLSMDGVGAYAAALEALRWGPSASNKQPWRIVRIDNAFHFYLARTKGYGKESLLFTLLRLADLQRVDIGIAMCHFELTARESKLTGRWIVQEPDIAKPDDKTEYIVSWSA
jgi:nitroreductase